MRPIDADALIDEIKTCLWDWESVNGITAKTVLNQTISDIGNMPTIDPVKHGKWEDVMIYRNVTEPTGAYYHKCSACGFKIGNSDKSMRYSYCPNCGAQMVRERWKDATD